MLPTTEKFVNFSSVFNSLCSIKSKLGKILLDEQLTTCTIVPQPRVKRHRMFKRLTKMRSIQALVVI